MIANRNQKMLDYRTPAADRRLMLRAHAGRLNAYDLVTRIQRLTHGFMATDAQAGRQLSMKDHVLASPLRGRVAIILMAEARRRASLLGLTFRQFMLEVLS